MKTCRFAVIILAGGLSTRMKEFKPLLPLGDTTVLGYAINSFQNTGVDVFVVVGYRRNDIANNTKHKNVTIVYNPDFEKGMFSSVQTGVRILKPGYQSFFLLPVDIPMVSPSTIKQLVIEGTKNPGKIIYPVFDGKRGHPPLIPANLIPVILSWKKDGGLKTALETQEKSALEIPVNDENILLDIDTPEDYKKLLKRYRQET